MSQPDVPSAEKRKITVEDLTRITYVDDPQFSPDGRWIAFVQVMPNAMEKRNASNIYLAAADGSRIVQLTRGGKDSQPRWSPDGQTLAFVSARNGAPQVYLLPVNAPGGEPRTLTSHKNGATSPVWSPDGAHIAFMASVNAEERQKEDSGEKEEPPRDELEAKYRKDRAAEDKKAYFDPMPMQRIPYRRGTTYVDDRTAHIYVIPTAEGLEGDAAKARRLTNGDHDYSPPQWSADGRLLYTTRPWDSDADEPFRWQNIYTVKVEDGEETRWLADDVRNYYGVLPSPDGAWLAVSRGDSSITDTLTRFVLFPAGGGDPIVLSEELDRTVYNYEWTPDGRLFTLIGSEGNVCAYEVDIEARAFRPVHEGRFFINNFDVAPDGSIAYSLSTPWNPCELGYKPVGGAPVVLTKVNKKFLDEVIVQETHEMRFMSPSGTEIQGWYILPAGYEEGQKVPLALNIHGGPHVMWSDSARSMWHEWQLHAARGYAVFYCNPRGGDGYGEAFQRALHADWGDVAMTDIMAGVDALLEKGYVDETRMAVTGGSYGGYMTAWIVGHTDRFAAAVSQRGVYNLTSFYGTSDVPILISSEFDAEPWEDPEKLWEHSPLAYAHNIKTPLLIIHSENDFRVPIEQGEQLFAWVRRATDTPVKMFRYPREGHELSRSGEPNHRISRLTEMVNWFDRYCMPQSEEAAEG